MSKHSLESVRYGTKKIKRNGLESVLSQSSLGNAKEIYSAVEHVLTLTYLNNKHLHTQVCWPIQTWATHNHRQKKQHNMKCLPGLKLPVPSDTGLAFHGPSFPGN